MSSIRMTFRMSCSTGVAAAMLLFLVAPAAWGQAIDIPLLVTGAHGPSTWVSGQYAHQFETNIEGNASGDFKRNSVMLIAGHRFELSDDVFLVGNAAYQGSYYDFAKSFTGITGYKWNDVHQITLMTGLGWKIDENWTLVGIGMIRSAGEGGSSFDDTLTGGGALMIDYNWSDDLSTGLLIGVLSQIEDSASLVPIPTIDWKFADDWKFHFGLVTMAAYPGVGPELTWNASDEVQLGFGGSYQRRRYRLESNSVASSKGVGEETSFPLFARMAWAPSENTTIGLMGGVALGGEIRSGNKGGTKIRKRDYDPAPFLGASLGFRW